DDNVKLGCTDFFARSVTPRGFYRELGALKPYPGRKISLMRSTSPVRQCWHLPVHSPAALHSTSPLDILHPKPPGPLPAFDSPPALVQASGLFPWCRFP